MLFLILKFSLLISGFQFNLANAILGRFVDNSHGTLTVRDLDEAHALPCGLPYFDFIATCLLPCGPVDGWIEKFTISGDAGNPPGPGEDLMTALHAFTHYVVVFSCGNLLLCDIQSRFKLNSVHPLVLTLGMLDKNGVMCLIDPQSHSYV